jgi:serine protease Do
MLDPIRPKLKWLALAATAFVGGVTFASGLDWTTGSQAATPTLSAPPAHAVKPVADLSEAFSAISETVMPAVVTITTERKARMPRGHPTLPPELRDMIPFRSPGGGQEVPQQAGGSGFLISPDGYIMTNNHVVEDAEKIDIVLQDRRTFAARVVGRDPTTDIAVIKVEGSGFPTLNLGRSENTRVGEWVLAIGNPLSLGNTVTAGIVSAKGRPLGIIGQSGGGEYAIEDFIQTDAAINPGNSGGPLVNLRGEAIAVNTAIYSQTGFYSGYGFAVPMDLARSVAEDLIAHGRVRRPVLGVSIGDVTPEDAEAFRLPTVSGAVVQDFTDESPAARAGVEKGDVIVAVDGEPVERVNALQRRIRGYKPGQTVTLELIRYGQKRQAKVPLGEAPVPRVAATPAATPAPERPEEGTLGLQVGALTPQLAQSFGFARSGGVVVTRVRPYSPADRKGITERMQVLALDREPLKDIGDFERRLAAKKAGSVVSLLLADREGRQRIVNVRMP